MPELPKSKSPAGDLRPPTPTPSTSQVPSGSFSVLAPKAAMALALLTTSSASKSPVMRVWPLATAPNINARCDMDLSPGTLIRPLRAVDLREMSGVGFGAE